MSNRNRNRLLIVTRCLPSVPVLIILKIIIWRLPSQKSERAHICKCSSVLHDIDQVRLHIALTQRELGADQICLHEVLNYATLERCEHNQNAQCIYNR